MLFFQEERTTDDIYKRHDRRNLVYSKRNKGGTLLIYPSHGSYPSVNDRCTLTTASRAIIKPFWEPAAFSTVDRWRDLFRYKTTTGLLTCNNINSRTVEGHICLFSETRFTSHAVGLLVVVLFCFFLIYCFLWLASLLLRLCGNSHDGVRKNIWRK